MAYSYKEILHIPSQNILPNIFGYYALLNLQNWDTLKSSAVDILWEGPTAADCHTEWLQFACLFLTRQPPVGHGLLIHEVSRSHTTTQHIR